MLPLAMRYMLVRVSERGWGWWGGVPGTAGGAPGVSLPPVDSTLAPPAYSMSSGIHPGEHRTLLGDEGTLGSVTRGHWARLGL